MGESNNKDLPQEDQFIQRIRPLRSSDVTDMATVIRQADSF